jgi:hypothetical protein
MRFSTKTAATIPPATGTTPSFVPAEITLLDMTQANLAAQQPMSGGINRLETTVQFFGKTTGGQSVESNEFSFPVDICNDCLVVFSASDNNPLLNPQPNCAGVVGAGSGSTVATPCRIGQDEFVDCSLCLTNEVCNPPTTMRIIDAGAG